MSSGKRHPRHLTPPGIAEQRAEPPCLLVDALDQRVGGIRGPAAAQRVDHDPVLALHPIEHLRQTARGPRACQHAQQVSGRRGVDDDVLVSCRWRRSRRARSRPAISSMPGQRQPQQPGDIVAIEPGAAQRDLLEQLAAIVEPRVECGRRVDFDGLETGDAPDRAREAPSGCCSASPSDGAGSVETISVRRPARAARQPRAAAHVVLPTPPLPPTNLNVGTADAGRRSVVLVAFERGIDARDLVLAGREAAARALLASREISRSRVRMSASKRVEFGLGSSRRARAASARRAAARAGACRRSARCRRRRRSCRRRSAGRRSGPCRG